MPKPNCENLSNSASAKPSYFFLFFFYLFSFFSFLLATSSCRFFFSFFLFSFFLLTRIPNLRYLTFEKHQKRP